MPGTAAPVGLNFLDVVGSKTSGLLPTGNAVDVFDGIEFTCIDVAMPLIIARAEDFGLTGYETAEEALSRLTAGQQGQSARPCAV